MSDDPQLKNAFIIKWSFVKVHAPLSNFLAHKVSEGLVLNLTCITFVFVTLLL